MMCSSATLRMVAASRAGAPTEADTLLQLPHSQRSKSGTMDLAIVHKRGGKLTHRETIAAMHKALEKSRRRVHQRQEGGGENEGMIWHPNWHRTAKHRWRTNEMEAKRRDRRKPFSSHFKTGAFNHSATHPQGFQSNK